MKKILLFLFITLTSLCAQQVKFPSVALSRIGFKITPENAGTAGLTIAVKGERFDSVYTGTPEEIAASVIEIPESGKYEVTVNGKPQGDFRVIPGWFSLLPPLLAISLALIIRQALVALAAGIYLGALFLYDYNPFIAFLRFADDLILNSVLDTGHIYIILFTLLIGGVVGVISGNGGTAGLAAKITKYAKKPKSGMVAGWLMGISVFFDDYSNTLIIGNMMRPITDKLRISREKLAYIVDSTSAPIASISIISTWIGYELGLIADGLKTVGIEENAYNVFLNTIPYRFYPIAALFLVFMTSWFQRDFGPMYKAEIKARKEGIAEEYEQPEKHKVSSSKWTNAAIPIFVVLFGTVAGLVYTGIISIQVAGLEDYSVRSIISSSDAYASLLWASLAASIVAILMTVSKKLMNLEKALHEWNSGVQSMVFACTILVFAWGISKVTYDLHTADYLISVLRGSIDPYFLPAYIFIICGFISFATGTSWGTMAIVMPIVIPLTYKLSVAAGVEGSALMHLIYGVVSSVLAGSVFGDHCSPIADTTILSSMSSKCDHMAHVNTQMPYAITAGAVSVLLGDFLTGFRVSPYISIILILTTLTIILFAVGKRTDRVNELT